MWTEKSRRANGELTIMVIDDDKFSLHLITKVLTNVGVGEVVSFTNAGDALAHLQTYDVDLIVCDLLMKGMDGLQFIQSLKTEPCIRPRIRDIPIVVLSAHSDQRLVKAAIRLGANGYLVKPMVPAKLFEMIKRFGSPDAPARRDHADRGTPATGR